jgi:hypothetical protein
MVGYIVRLTQIGVDAGPSSWRATYDKDWCLLTVQGSVERLHDAPEVVDLSYVANSSRWYDGGREFDIRTRGVRHVRPQGAVWFLVPPILAACHGQLEMMELRANLYPAIAIYSYEQLSNVRWRVRTPDEIYTLSLVAREGLETVVGERSGVHRIERSSFP